MAALEHLNLLFISTEHVMFCAFGLGLHTLFYKITLNDQTIDIRILLLAGGSIGKDHFCWMEMF